ncbi:MAG TPA: Uma2 family endonuclease [Blastocatellia bacterium]|nr:Uma2 family endonuclease [Blastocatellia bacterium]
MQGLDSQVSLRGGQPVAVKHWAFTVDDYMRMLEAGILTEDDRIELIEGEIIEMSPIGDAHAACVKKGNALFHRVVGQRAIVSVQDPIRLDNYSEPQPDLALLKPRGDFYAQSKPTPADVLLIVEVADSSAQYDRNVKVPLYARALIPAVWLVDLNAGVIEVYSQPAGGAYQAVQTARRGDRLTIDSLPGLAIPVDDILG